MTTWKSAALALAASTCLAGFSAWASDVTPMPSTSLPATIVAQAQTASAPQAVSAEELDVLESFSDTVYNRRVSYFQTIKDEIAFNGAIFSDFLRREYSETFRDFAETTPRRSNWMMPTDSGWVSAGGADLYEVHLALMASARNEKGGKVLYGPVMITDAMQVDLKDRSKRVEARFGNKILAFKSVENRDRYAELVKQGRILELQDMQCAMAPVHPKRPHIAGATRMVVVAEELKNGNNEPVLVRTYNSAHVAASYDLDRCAAISNTAFGVLSEGARTAAGASILVKQKKLDDMRVPAYTPVNPIQNIQCAPLS